jgi:hypothetical protein
MGVNDRRVFWLLLVFVIGIALWRGGVVLLLGVILFGLLYLLKLFLAWKASDMGGTFRSDVLGIRSAKRRPHRRPPRDH